MKAIAAIRNGNEEDTEASGQGTVGTAAVVKEGSEGDAQTSGQEGMTAGQVQPNKRLTVYRLTKKCLEKEVVAAIRILYRDNVPFYGVHSDLRNKRMNACPRSLPRLGVQCGHMVQRLK